MSAPRVEPQAHVAPVELRDAAWRLWRRAGSIAACGIAGAIAGLFVASRIPVLYQATAEIRLVREVQISLGRLELDLDRDASQVVALLYSPRVRAAVAGMRDIGSSFGIDASSPDQDPRWAAEYQRLVTIVAPAPDSNTVWVVARNVDSVRAAALANAVAEQGSRVRRAEIEERLAAARTRFDLRRQRIAEMLASLPAASSPGAPAIPSTHDEVNEVRRKVLLGELERVEQQSLLVDRVAHEPFDPWILQSAAAPLQHALPRERVAPVAGLAALGLVLGTLVALLRPDDAGATLDRA